MAYPASPLEPTGRVSLAEVQTVVDAPYRSGLSFDTLVRHGSPLTVGMLVEWLPNQVEFTDTLTDSFSTCTPPPHFREYVEASEGSHRENINLLRAYLTGALRTTPKSPREIYRLLAQPHRRRA